MNNSSQSLRKTTGQIPVWGGDIADYGVVPKVLNIYDIYIIMVFAGWEVNENQEK